MNTPEPHRCTAASSRTGQPCRNRAIAGATVCRMHGGAAPQVRRAAERRLAEAQAAQAASEVYLRLAGQPPADPVAGIKALAARFHAIESDLFSRIAAEPEQLAILLPAWGAAAAKYLDVLTAIVRAEPPRPQAATLADLLDSFDRDGVPPPPPRRALRPAAAADDLLPPPSLGEPPERQDAAPMPSRRELREQADAAEHAAELRWRLRPDGFEEI